jgi:IS30 family transposase
MQSPSQQRSRWSSAETGYLRHLVWRGTSIAEIATRLRRTASAIQRKIRQLERSLPQ